MRPNRVTPVLLTFHTGRRAGLDAHVRRTPVSRLPPATGIDQTAELDRAVAHRLTDALFALVQTGHRSWTVDAAGISFCDAEGLRVLAAGVALAESRGGTLRVTDPSPITAHLLRLVGMTDLLVDVADRSPTGVA